ncbi:hypothetical protein K491DRAFT_490126 [Lophiostoma macrostomum CBS 122681]|uniref:Uncharacterized protein n=1 Tax=Lophiostoma macrostomum CBS 122681 TaxID=1314788 RepID=A0A6A6T3A0_9PLEO|nr:hypothetical protein K491DRAFT_490126 [Lophiostoma macrostomum CBS 122681]
MAPCAGKAMGTGLTCAKVTANGGGAKLGRLEGGVGSGKCTYATRPPAKLRIRTLRGFLRRLQFRATHSVHTSVVTDSASTACRCCYCQRTTSLHPMPSYTTNLPSYDPSSSSWLPHNSTYTLHYSTVSSHHLPHTQTHTNPHPHPNTTILASTATGTGTISHHPTHNSTSFHSPSLTKSSSKTQAVSTSTAVVQTPAATWQGQPEAPLFTDAAFKDAVVERWRVGWVLTVLFGSLAIGL